MSIYRVIRRNASPPLWTPSSLSDLRCWLDASDSSTVFDATTGGSLPGDGIAVARLEDKSGNAHHMTQATSGARPVRQTSEVNSKDVLEFASSADFMETGAQPFGASLSEFTCVLVIKTRASSLSSDVVWTLRNGGQDHSLAILEPSSLRFRLANNSSYEALATSAVSAGTVYMIGTEYKGSTDVMKLRKNAASVADDPGGVPTSIAMGSTDKFELGWSLYTQNTFDGMFCELVFCDVLLSSSDREKLEGYLAHKWGLAGDLPSDHPYKNSAPTI